MPCLKIFTSLPRSKIPADFANKIVPVLSKTVRKPENKFIVVVSADCAVTFFGQNIPKPAAVAVLESIGNIGLEENKIITAEITKCIEEELGIPRALFRMSIYDLKGSNVGRAGKLLI